MKPPILICAINESPVLERLSQAINVRINSEGECVIRYGVYPNKRGLQVFDREAADAIVRASNSKLDRAADLFRGLPIYIGHPDDSEWAKANPSVRAAAVGRMPKLSAEADGLHIKTAFNDQGKQLLQGEAPVYDSFSPNWGMVQITYQGRKAFRPVELYSIGLTNQPNIPGTYIGLNEAVPGEPDSAMKSYIIALLAALGRPVANATAVTDEQLATAVNEAVSPAAALAADALKFVNATNEITTLKGQITAAQAQVTTAVNEAAGLRTSLAQERTARAGVVIFAAINEGRITEANRAEWLGKFTAAGADFAAVEADLGKLKKAVNTKEKTVELGHRRGGPTPESQNRVRAINEAVAEKKKSGLSHDEAYNAVRREKPDLFQQEAKS